MVSTVRGGFGKVTGTLVADGKDLARSKVQATIDASSSSTHEPKRDEPLKSADFLDVAKFPTITFVSKKIELAGVGRWKMTGDLTLSYVPRLPGKPGRSMICHPVTRLGGVGGRGPRGGGPS